MSDQLFKRSHKALHASIGEDVVALHVENGQCYGMDNVSAAVWNLLEEPIGVQAICDRLRQSYDVTPDVCRRDVERLLDNLRSEGLIESVGSR